MKNVLLTLCVFFVSLAVVHGQTTEFTGRVTDASSGNPLPGVTVMIEGTQTGTATDATGNFSLSASSAKAANLIFRFIGYKTQTVAATPGKALQVSMPLQTNSLQEVVAIGYGTTTRKSLTGAVASIDAKELKDIPVTSVLQALEGRLAGVHVTTTEGGPDAAINVRVRGGTSITQDNSPLYIVDGFRVSNINDIPVDDIQSIDVLKDASSTAIYGAEGANGVVLITTKSGTAGQPQITLNAYVGLSRVYNLTSVLSPYEYVYYQKELDPGSSISGTSFYGMYGLWNDVDIYKSEPGINWQDSLFGNTGVHRNYNLGMSGGDKTLRYNVNYTHDGIDYIMLNSAYKRDYFSARLNKKISSKLSVDVNTRVWNTTITGPSVSDGRKLRDAIKYAPVKSLSSLGQTSLEGTGEDVNSAEALSALNNPIYNIINEHKMQNRFNTSFNAGLTWKIINGLTFSSKGSYAFVKNYTDDIWLKKTGQASANGGQPVAQRTDEKGNIWSIQNTLTYDFNFNHDLHQFTLLVGQEMYSSQTNEMVSESKFFPPDFSAKDVLAMWNYGTPQPTYTTIGEPSRISSFFGRLNYIYHDRYIMTLTGREDGKNVFAPTHRWGFFPGVAFAWRLSDENFMASTRGWLSNAKLRLSYGEVGNARVGSYWRQQYSFESSDNRLIYIDDKPQSALVTSSVLKNENLTWETTISSDIGLDLGFFNQRLSVTFDAYRNVDKDLILAVPLPSNSGYSVQYQNIGSTSNRGIEIAATAQVINRKDFQLTANFNMAFNRNNVEELAGSDTMIASSDWGGYLAGSDDYRVIVGKPVGLMYGYVLAGNGMYSFNDFTWNDSQKKWMLKDGVPDASSVITTSGNYFGPGHIKLKKLKGTGTKISPDSDRTIIGVAQPKFTGGFALNASYKGFDLSAMFNFCYGNDIYNADKIDYTTYAGSKRYQNASSIMSLSNRFTTIDPATGDNIMYGNDANPKLLQELNKNARIWDPIMGSSILTNWAIEDGSYLRLSNLSIGYTLPAYLSKKILMQKLRCYVSAYNLKCWTKYSGQDPEVDTGGRLTPGLDYSAYPKSKTIVFGINITF
jgi:TonB-linked SusC/RagA family outer membrane protein